MGATASKIRSWSQSKVMLRDIKVKSRYKTSDNLLENFLLPVIRKTKDCSMAVGFFTSSGIHELRDALENILENKGRIRIITSPKLSTEDYECLNEPDAFKERISAAVDAEINQALQNAYPVELLAYLYKNGFLEIKIATYENPEAGLNGQFHMKVAVFDDGKDLVTWEGSVNCTKRGFLSNFESATVGCTWKGGDSRSDSLERQSEFELMWGSQEEQVGKGLKIFDFPEASKNKLIELAPDDESKLKKSKEKYEGASEERNFNIKPARDYQLAAVNGWLKANKKGVFEMATGTGKTYAGLYSAIAAIKGRGNPVSRDTFFQTSFQKDNNFLLVILVPYNHLIHQWREDCESFGFNCHDSDSDDWKKSISRVYFEGEPPQCLLLTYATFVKDEAQFFLKGVSVNNKMLLADEVHHFGAKSYHKIDVDYFDYKLGLSATPRRKGDEVGTDNIFKKIGSIVEEATYTLKEAIKGRPPLRTKYLCSYDYRIRDVFFTAEEQETYNEICRKIAQKSASSDRDYTAPNFDNNATGLGALLGERLRLIGGASDKLILLKEDILNLKARLKEDFKHVLIYCGPRMWDDCREFLNGTGIIFSSITFKDASQPDAIERRKLKLREFASGDIPVMMAKKCLDEGLNIPNAKYAFILQHTTNEMEFIQRRGRVLRLAPNKKHAIITDYVVKPYNRTSGELTYSEIKLIERELNRMRDFADTCNNFKEASAKIDLVESLLD